MFRFVFAFRMTLQYVLRRKCVPVSGQGNRSCDSRFSKCHTHQCGSGSRPPATSVRPRGQSFPAPPCMETRSSWCGSAANADGTARSPGPNRSLSGVADNRTADARREKNAVAQTKPTTPPRQQSATATASPTAPAAEGPEAPRERRGRLRPPFCSWTRLRNAVRRKSGNAAATDHEQP